MNEIEESKNVSFFSNFTTSYTFKSIYKFSKMSKIINSSFLISQADPQH